MVIMAPHRNCISNSLDAVNLLGDVNPQYPSTVHLIRLKAVTILSPIGSGIYTLTKKPKTK